MRSLYQSLLNRKQVLTAISALTLLWLTAVQVTLVISAPITLSFTTTVNSYLFSPLAAVQTTSTLPFSVAVGDPLTVTFSYEPSSGSGMYLENEQLEILVGSQRLTANPFEINIVHNGGGVIDIRGRFANAFSPAVEIGYFAVDQATVECSNGLATYCGVIAGHDDFSFTPLIVLEQAIAQNTLNSNDLFANPTLWNSFQNREMEIGFNNGMKIGAYITQINAVPEVSSLTISIVAIAIFSFRRSRLRSS